MRIFIFPYKAGSSSAKALADALVAKRIKLEGSNYVQRRTHRIINWGSTSCPYDIGTYNWRDSIALCADKLRFFNELHCTGYLPDYTTDKDVAVGWIHNGSSVVCRTVLDGHSGDGIVLADTEDELVEAPLYTKYVKKKDEYRIHCFKNNSGNIEVFHSQRKARRADCDTPNWRIRNHANGFNFVMGSCNPPDIVLDVAKSLFSRTGLDFGAVDIGYNERDNRATVYEVNTAPGLEGTTLTKYVDMFMELIR